MSQSFKINRWNILFQLVSNMIKTLVPQVKDHFSTEDSIMFEKIIKYFTYEDLATWLILDTEENRPVSIMAIDQLMMNIDYDLELFKTMKEGLLNSFNGLYRVNNITSEFIFLENLLFKEPTSHIPADTTDELEEGMIILARLVETDHFPLIFKVLHKVEPDMAEEFLDQFIPVYHMMDEFKRCSPTLLKHRGMDIFLLYSNTYQEVSYSEEELISDYQSQLHDLFHEEVIAVDPLDEENDLLETFIFIQEEYLEGRNLSFQHLDEINLKELMRTISKDGVFESDLELSEFVSFLEEWALGQGFDEKVDEIKEIQSYIFKYKMLLQDSTSGIYLDEYIMNCIYEEEMSLDPLHFMQKFNRFLELFQQNTHFTLTEVGRLTRSSIDTFVDELDLELPAGIRNYSEIHFLQLHLWHVMGIMKNLVHREGKKLIGTSRFDHYKRLGQEGQLGLWIQSIFNEAFLELAYSNSPKAFSSGDGVDMRDTYGLIFKALSKDEMSKYELIKAGIHGKDLFVLDLFEALSMVTQVNSGFYSLTNLGKKIGSYYNFLAGSQKEVLYMDRP